MHLLVSIHYFVHLRNIYWLPTNVKGILETMINKIDKVPALMKLVD